MRTLLVVALLVSGCAEKYRWVKPDGTAGLKRIDKYECERDARSTFRERGETRTEVDLPFFRRCMEARGWMKEPIP